jgi:hypothetical protein
MGLLLIVLGIVIALLVNYFLGILLVIIGIVLLFVPGVPYGYSSWRGRRGP